MADKGMLTGKKDKGTMSFESGIVCEHRGEELWCKFPGDDEYRRVLPSTGESSVDSGPIDFKANF